MKNKLFAFAISIAGVALTPTALAESQVYGVAHVDAAQLDDGEDTYVDVTSNSSRVGVKGSEDLGGGLAALYKFEFGVDVSGNGDISGRNQHIGLSSRFGTVLVGRFDIPYKQSLAPLDPFEDTVADYNNVIGVNGALDIRAENVIGYATPEIGGFSALIAHIPETAEKSEGDENASDIENRAFSASLSYEGDSLFLGVGYLRVEDTDTRIAAAGSLKDATVDSLGVVQFDNVTGVRGGIGYSFKALEFGMVYEEAIFETKDFDELKYVNVYLTTSYFAGDNALKIAYGTIDADDENAIHAGDASFSALGTEHAFSKSTSAYIVYSRMVNNGSASWILGPSGVGPGHDVKPGVGEDPDAFAIGVIHKF